MKLRSLSSISLNRKLSKKNEEKREEDEEVNDVEV